jgi:hypothetical protein
VPQTCKICKHPKRKEIEKEIVSGIAKRVIAGRYKVGRESVDRHKAHIRQVIKKVRDDRDIKAGKSAFETFNDMVQEAERKYRNAQGMLQVGWFREWRSMIELGFKLGMEAQREKTIGPLHDHPRWVFLRTTLMNVLSAFPDARKAVAGALKDLE